MPVPYFTRVRLKEDASVQSLIPLLLPNGSDNAVGAHHGHQLMWSLFSDQPTRARDFLWREMNPGSFYILSARVPQDAHALFEIAPPIPFAPALEQGDRLTFSLRANALKRRWDEDRQRTTKHDVVMHALRQVEKDERAALRLETAQQEGRAWLARQGCRAGFAVTETQIRVDRYEQHRVRRRKGAPMSFATIEIEGALTVTDVPTFLSSVTQGFGGAKAYGCGLMLIKRLAGTPAP